MDFIANRKKQNEEMLATIGIKSVDELFAVIPKQIRFERPINDDGISESEGLRHMEALADKNTFHHFDNYLGAGAYEHYVPAIVGAICSKSEFLTSYTPYQAEASQGMLQAMFEFQSVLCEITGLDVANASLYDAASACAEALLMAIRSKKRNKVLVAGNVHPHYRATIKQYFAHPELVLEVIPIKDNGCIDDEQFADMLDEQTAAVLIQYPNLFGAIEDIKTMSALSKQKGALTIVCANPLVYGLFSSANELGADIAVGDCQPFGIPLQYGGPYVGYMVCRKELMRQLPGRIVGETADSNGKKGFVLTLQAREQHIRREKATSNICTNQALAALATLITLSWYGKEGFRQLALTNFQRAAYLREQLQQITLPTPFSTLNCFNEFVVKFDRPMEQVLEHFRKHKIEPGLDLGRFYPQFRNHLLIAVTEMKSRLQLDKFIRIANSL